MEFRQRGTSRADAARLVTREGTGESVDSVVQEEGDTDDESASVAGWQDALAWQARGTDVAVKSRFTWLHTVCFVMKQALPTSGVVCAWSLFCMLLHKQNPEISVMMQSDFTLKALTFLVGLLTSMTLTESLDRYRKCYLALLGFREELRSVWYFLQLRVMSSPALKFLLDAHMCWYSLSVVRYLYEQTGEAMPSAQAIIQPELRPLTLFLDYEDGGYPSYVSSDPNLAELLLVSWFHATGLLESDLTRRWRIARRMVTALINAERVKTPKTSRHLQMLALNLFFVLIPVCAEQDMTKLMAPMIALILVSLLKLSMELEDPFGFDTHDLPWREVLASVSTCGRPELSDEDLAEVIDWYNNGSRSGIFTECSDHLVSKNMKKQYTFRLGEYLTQPAVMSIHRVGKAAHGPDAPFGFDPIPRKATDESRSDTD